MKIPWFLRSNTLIGVDFGVHYLKVAKVKIKNGQPEVVNLDSKTLTIELNEHSIEDSVVTLAEVFAQIDYKGEAVTVTLSGEQLITRIIQVPTMNDVELESTLFYEAEDMLPSKVENWVIRHTVLQSQPDQQGLMQVLLIAAPRQRVLLFYQVFQLAGINVTAIDIPYYALWRLYGNRLTNRNENYMIVNLCYKSAQIVVVSDNLIQQIRSIIFDTSERLISKLERYLEIYNQQSNHPIKQIVFSGEISQVVTVLPLIENTLDIDVEIGKPWLLINQQIAEKNQDLSCYSIAIGSALRGYLT